MEVVVGRGVPTPWAIRSTAVRSVVDAISSEKPSVLGECKQEAVRTRDPEPLPPSHSTREVRAMFKVDQR